MAWTSLLTVAKNRRPSATVGAPRIGASNFLRQISLPVAMSSATTSPNAVVA
jgi:hypothetical protein